MRLLKYFHIVTTCGVLLQLAACGNKKSSAPPAAATDSTLATAIQTGPAPFVSAIATSRTASWSGLPSNPSNASRLAVSIEGTSVQGYRYALLDDVTSCDGAQYSESQAKDTLISDAISKDGVKTLCAAVDTLDDSGLAKVSLLSYSWFADQTAPRLTVETPAVLGPALIGDTLQIPINVEDAGSGIQTVMASLSNGDGNCLNTQLTAYDAACPNTMPLAPYQNNYRAVINTGILENGLSYTATIWANDLANNLSAQQTASFTWDTDPPGSVASLTATAGLEEVTLSWAPVGDAQSYVVVRKADSAVSAVPSNGAGLVRGEHLGDNNFVACVTTSTTCTDTSLTAFAWYHYRVFAIDGVLNTSSTGARASAQPGAKPAFQGLNFAYLWAPSRRIVAEWQKFVPNSLAPTAINYGIYTSALTGQQDYVAAPVASVTNKENLSFTDAGSSNNLYLVGRSWVAGGAQDPNTRELRVKLLPGTHHKLAANGRFLGQDPFTQAFLRSAWAVEVDPYGNVIFSGASGTINALCKETTQAYYCKGRTADKVYTIAGADGTDDGADGALASASAIGDIYAIRFDGGGNMVIADATYFRVRIVCYNPLAPGACNGKKQAYIYHLTGTGSAGDGLDDMTAKTNAIGLPYGLQIDSYGNITLADGTYRRLRTLCYDVNHGYCNGRTLANTYVLAGTGTLADGSDASPRLNAAFGSPRGLAADARGNLYFPDFDYRRVRVLCLDVTVGSGVCQGKVSGSIYRLAGTGAAVDGADNVVAASNGIGQSHGIAVSAAGNVYFTDSYYRLRAICYENSSDYYCNGRTVGNMYRLAGTGANTDGGHSQLAVNTAIGDPRNVALDTAGNLIVADNLQKRLRVICANPGAGNVCNGNLADYHYNLVGTGSGSQGWQMNAMATPIGTPQGLAEDQYGNVYVGDSTYFVVRVICFDTSHAGFCSGKTAGNSYFIAGTGVTGNAADNVLAISNPIGQVYALAMDTDNNLFISDSTNRMVRAVCANVSGTGFCAGKVAGNIYRYAGSGTAGDAADNVVASSATLGILGDLALDAYNNVWLADNQYFRVRVVCRQLSGYCTGKTIGNVYRVAGTGATGDGADNSVATTTAMGAPAAIAADAWNNIIFGDASYFRVRVLCNNTAGGFCTGKTAGRSYRLLGTGVTGDGGDDTAAGATAIGIPFGVAADASGNIYVADSSYRRVRAVCLNVSSRFCQGLNASNAYRVFGSSIVGDSASGVAGILTRLDTPGRDGLLLSVSGHFIYAGSTGTLRYFVGY